VRNIEDIRVYHSIVICECTSSCGEKVLTSIKSLG
jgi:hypothetical protein